MSTLRISDAPLLPDVDGTEKIPTGGRGDYTISVDQIKGHIFQDIGKELVGLGNVDNTSDLDKPVSTAQQAALNLKADKTYVDTNLDLKADKTNVYTRSETSLALSKKADLVNGVIPENQIPSSFNDVLEFTTTNLPIIGESGKIYVTTDNNKTWRWGGNKYVEISGWNPDSVSKRETIPTYYTKESGVDPVTGVADGAYFNVRSSNDESYVDEYQNVSGVPTTTGKSYPSSNAKWDATSVIDASGKNQQQINNKIFKEIPSIVDFGAQRGKDFDSGVFIQDAIDWAVNNGIWYVRVPAGDWMTTITLELAGRGRNSRDGVILVGENCRKTRLLLKTTSDTQPLLLSMSPSGTHTAQGFKGITLRPHPDNLYKGVGLKLVGTCFMEVDDYRIERFNIGQHYYNTREFSINDGDEAVKNAFCEYNRFRNGRLEKNNTNILMETAPNGDSSFHGNGFYEVQNQVKEGGIGIHLKGTANKIAVWYNSFVHMNFWTTVNLADNMTILKAEYAQCSGLDGSIVCEGTGYIRYNNTSFEFEGNFTSLRNSEYPVFQGDDVGVIGGASIRFRNLTSKSALLAESNSAVINTKYLQEPQFLQSKSRNTAGDRLTGAFIKRVTNSNTPRSGSYEGLAIGARTDCEVFLGEFPIDGGEYQFRPRLGFLSNAPTMNVYANDYSYRIKYFNYNGVASDTNTGYTFNRGYIQPDVTNTVSLGNDNNRFAQARFQAWDINTTGLNPTSDSAFEIGSPTRKIKKIHTARLTMYDVLIYADNAAAKTGGLAVGDVYRTSTGQLMIVY